ncbi:MAG: DNA-binding protein [Clostridiales bacterium]|nr:DNA-binding protein [Clostridiales bacterium]
MFDKVTETNLLYDFYAQLLTGRQREVTRLYHCENLSLAEIGAELSISRQGVHDALKSAEKALAEYERILGLVRRFEYAAGLVKDANAGLDTLIKGNETNKELTDKLYDLKRIVEELGQ